MTKRCLLLAACCLLPVRLHGQFTLTREQMIAYTSKNPFERFADGRPKVPDDLLERVRGLVIEEAYGAVRAKGFPNQFAGDWKILNPGKKLVGRAFTVQFMPTRPDVAEAMQAEATAKGIGRLRNQTVIDMLGPNDVIVVDLFGKVDAGTFVGDKLAYYIWKTTGTGMVIDGGMFWLGKITPTGMPAYYRGTGPDALGNVMITGINIPIRIGHATVMPGDVVLGDEEGLFFIPPHLVNDAIDAASGTMARDAWIKQKMDLRKYKSSELYGRPSDPALAKELDEYVKAHPAKKQCGVLAFCLCVLLRAQGLVRAEAADDAMGATFSVVAYGENRAPLDAAVAAAFQELHRLDRLLSNYDPGSEWSEVNRNAAERPIAASRELFQLLEDCLRYSQESEGAFDITVGPLMKLWGFYKGEGSLPRGADVAKAIERVGYRHVLLNRDAATVRFDRYGVELDPGGIGKGYAVDRMIAVLRVQGVNTALVSAAGSSIYGMGAPPDNPAGWPITIREPGDPRRTAGKVFLKNMSLSTSGSYEKFFWAEGRRYSHIMDPRTGYPAQGTSSVSVLAPRTIDSEAWAKPYFVNGRAWTAKHKPADFRIFYCDDGKEQACTWIP